MPFLPPSTAVDLIIKTIEKTIFTMLGFYGTFIEISIGG
jgi:hypothetical protein